MNSSIKIICKKNALKNGLFPIYLRVTINRKCKFYSTPYHCNLSEWDENQGEFKSKFRNSLHFNKALRKIKDNAADVLSTLEREYQSYNLILFDKYYSLTENEGISFEELFQKEIVNLRENKQTSYAESMEGSLKTLKSFQKNLKHYTFENIDFQFLTDFENFLRKRGANDGGIGSYMRNIRTIYNKAIKYKVVQEQYYPFKDFKISKFKKQNVKKALSETEFKKIIDFKMEKTPHAINARYAYIFSYYTRGMNFTDISEIKWSDIENNQFSYHRNKTDVLLKIKLPDIPIIKEIFSFYKTYRPHNTPYIFPILKKEKKHYDDLELKKRKDSVRGFYNLQLKLILKICKIEKDITFLYSPSHFCYGRSSKRCKYKCYKTSFRA